MPTCTKSVCVHIHMQTQTYLKSKYYGESVVQTPVKIFIQNCFMAHCCVCMCICTHTHIYICALQKCGLIQDKENWCEWKTFTLGDHFEWHSVILQKQGLGFFSSCLISECFLFFISFRQYLKIPNTNGRTGIFCNLKLGNHFHLAFVSWRLLYWTNFLGR